MTIRRVKTDREIVTEAARALSFSMDDAEYDQACADMVEALRYARSIEWWAQFDKQPQTKDEQQ
jgi:hypothetical protein